MASVGMKVRQECSPGDAERVRRFAAAAASDREEERPLRWGVCVLPLGAGGLGAGNWGGRTSWAG